MIRYLLVAAIVLTGYWGKAKGEEANRTGSTSLLTNALTIGTGSTSLSIHVEPKLATISREGVVKIDWLALEAYIKKEPREQDHITLAFVRALLAVRYGTWEPLR